MEIDCYAARENHDSGEVLIDLELRTDGSQSHHVFSFTVEEANDLLKHLSEALEVAKEYEDD